MYPGTNVIGGSLATGGGALAVTGSNSVWLVIGGLTLVLAGMAVIRVAPKRRRIRR